MSPVAVCESTMLKTFRTGNRDRGSARIDHAWIYRDVDAAEIDIRRPGEVHAGDDSRSCRPTADRQRNDPRDHRLIVVGELVGWRRWPRCRRGWSPSRPRSPGPGARGRGGDLRAGDDGDVRRRDAAEVDRRCTGEVGAADGDHCAAFESAGTGRNRRDGRRGV